MTMRSWAILLLLVALGAPLARAAGVSLPLYEAIDRVAVSGRDARIAVKKSESARDEAGMAAAPLRPQVTAFATQTFLAYQPAVVVPAGSLNTSERHYPSYGVDVSQLIFDFGATKARYRAAQAKADSVSDDVFRQRNQAVRDVITAYWDVLEARQMRVVAQHEIGALARHAKDVTILYRDGVATRNDLLSVSVRFNAARQKLVTSRNQEKVARSRLNQLLSVSDDKDFMLQDVCVPIGAEALTPQQEAALALKVRPEFHMLDKAVRSLEFNEEASRASERPSIFAAGRYDYVDNRYQSRDDNWTALLGVKMSVFNGGLTKAETQKNRHDREGLMEERARLEEGVRFEVERAHWDRHNSRERLNLSRSAQSQAAENLRAARAGYHAGASTASDVLDAVTLLASSETDHWHSLYELRRSQARLMHAMGEDLSYAYLNREDDHGICE